VSIDKAVILAAGLGNRISAVSRAVPKPLLPIDGDGGTTTFLDWHLEALRAHGVREIYIVGNKVTHGAKLRATVPVTWILNPTDDLSTSGSGHSAWFAWNAHPILDGRSRVVLMDADLVYEPKIFDLLAAAPGERSKTLVCSAFRETNEEVLVFGDPPRFHGKGLFGTPLVGDSRCIGEATGIVLFEPGDHALVRAANDWVVRYSTAKARSEHEDVTQRLMSLGRIDAVSFGAERIFMEVDTPDEYEALVRDVWPRLAALRRA
jgi:choline kinase